MTSKSPTRQRGPRSRWSALPDVGRAKQETAQQRYCCCWAVSLRLVSYDYLINSLGITAGITNAPRGDKPVMVIMALLAWPYAMEAAFMFR